MAKTKYIIDTTIETTAKITPVDHAKLQKSLNGKKGVLFGRHSPDLKLMNANFEWETDKKDKDKVVGLTSVTMTIHYSGQIVISKAIDKSSKCYALVKSHEQEHQKICVAGVKAMTATCQKILKKHTDTILRSHKGDYVAFCKAETSQRKLIIAAYKEIDDGPFYKVAVKSLAIDTASHYGKISPHCQKFG